MGDFLTPFQVSFYLFQILFYAGIVVPFGEFIFHVELIVNHIGEETLPHVLIAKNRKSQQTDHGKDKTPPVCQSETKCRT